MNKQLKKIVTIAGIGSLAFGLISCGSSGGSSGNNPTPPSPTSTHLQVGNLGAIPTNAEAAGAAYPLTLFNNTQNVIHVNKVKATGVDPRLQITSDSQLFDYSSCRDIPVNGSCNILVKASALRVNNIGDNGQYGISIDGTNDKGAAYHEDQVISYENFAKKNALGTYYNTSSATTTNVIDTTQMGVTIPVYFDKAYNNVKLVSPNLNGTLIGCGLVNADGTYNISARSSCSIMLNFRGGKVVTSDVQLLANYAAPVKAAKSSKSTQSVKSLTEASSSIVNFNFVNITQSVALMTTGTVTSSLPTNNTTTQTVTFVNNGMSSATAISLSLADTSNGYGPTSLSSTQTIGSTSLAVTANTCTNQAGGNGTGTVSASQSCSVTFKMNGSSQFGTADLIMSYSTGVGTSTTNYNTYYYPVSALTGLSSSAAPSATEFINTSIGSQERSMIVTVTNTTPAQPITLSNLASSQAILKTAGSPGIPSGMTVSANTCTSGLVLNSGTTSCTYTITFDPTDLTAGQINNLYGIIAGTYVNQGITYQVSTSLNVPYSVGEATDLTTNPTQIQLTTNSGQPVYIPISIENTNGLGSGSISNITFDWAAIGLNNVTISSQSPSGCLTSLAYGNTCNVVFVYSPTNTESSNGYVNLPVSYAGGQFDIDDIPTTFEAISGNTNIQITNVIASDVNSPPVGHTGLGTSGSPYTFYNYGNSFSLQIEYTNESSAVANNFMIDGSTLPSVANGWTVATGTTTCGINGNSVNLGANESCVLELNAVNPNIEDALTYSNSLTFNFPSATYQESGQTLVRNVWDYSGQSSVNVSANQILSPSYSIGNGVIESVTGVSYYVYPITLSNNANAGQTAQISVAIDPSALNTLATPAGVGTSNTTPPVSRYSTSLAGGESVNPLYLWVPANGSNLSSTNFNLNANWNYTGMTPYQSSASASTSSAATGVIYSANAGAGLISVNWSGNVNNAVANGSSLLKAIGSTTVPSGNVTDLVQYKGYLYALTTTGLYSYAITPWVNTSGTLIPESTTNTGTGALTVTSSGASQINGILNNTPSAMSINSVGGTTYALVTESGTQTTAWPYTIATVINGVFTNGVGSFSGLTSGDIITSVAVGATGNIYLATDTKAVYSCGTVTAVASCSDITIAGFDSAAANSTVVSLAVSIAGGNVAVTQYVTDPSAAGQFTPATKYGYAADAGSGTSFNMSTINTFIKGLPFSYYYNLDATANSATQLLGLAGQTVSYGSSPYTHNTTNAGASINLASPSSVVTSSSFGAGNVTYYSFLSIGGNN
jgi:hypothetical protein